VPFDLNKNSNCCLKLSRFKVDQQKAQAQQSATQSLSSSVKILSQELAGLWKVEIALIDGQTPTSVDQSVRDQGIQRLPEFIKKLVSLMSSLDESSHLFLAKVTQHLNLWLEFSEVQSSPKRQKRKEDEPLEDDRSL